MRVMLVTPFTDVNEKCKNAPRPKVGDIDEVSGELKDVRGVLYYNLVRFGSFYAYQSDLFAVLPDTPAEVIEETELQTA